MINIFSSKKFTELAKKLVLLTKDFSILKHNLKGAFKSTKDEIDMHLDSINQNTNEIQTNYEYLANIEAKVDKLSDKVDEIQMQLNPHFYSQNFSEIELSKREQEIFLGIYTEEDRVSVVKLSKKLGLTMELCEALIGRIVAKGIPVVRQLVNGDVFISLDYVFKDLQARKNVLNIELAVSQMIE
ncbi:hypothetical protein HQ533_05925 [Candidatus Woesearchaeota archaeon]|nr:hypothetical protein [Candidatus Woesearchaeota archaeon]